MAIPELASMLPAMGIVLPNGSSLEGGTASIDVALQGPLERLVTTGTLSIDNTKLAGFDIGKKMASIEKFAGIKGGPDTEIQNFGATLRMDPEGITADRLQLIVPALGSVEGSGTSSAAHVLGFQNARHGAHFRTCWRRWAVRPFPSRCRVPQRTRCSAPI